MSTLFNHGIDSQLDFGHYFKLDFQESFYVIFVFYILSCLVLFLPNLLHLADLGAHIHLHSDGMGFFDLVL